jgi:hypothetical protein
VKNFALRLIATTLIGASIASAQISFNFVGLPQLVSVDGSSDQIAFATDANDHGFTVTTSTSLSGLPGYFGSITGTFTIGSVSTFGIVSKANISGLGIFKIFGQGADTAVLTADLSLVKISSVGSASVTVNPDAAINLTNFQYSGTDANLIAIRDGSITGITTISMQFVPGRSLPDLTQNGAYNSTSYSGSVLTQIPEASTYAALLAALTLSVVFVRRRQRLSA